MHTQQVGATTYTVNSLAATNTGAATSGTLRYCITQANMSVGPHTIQFSVWGTIAIGNNSNVLPTIVRAVTIDGTTAPGFAGIPLIIVDGTGTTSGNGITINFANCTIKGIEVRYSAYTGISIGATSNGFRIGSQGSGCVVRNSGYYGIQVSGADNGFIEASHIGVTADGSACAANGYDGIDLASASSNNQILGNHIACNGYNGIQIGGGSNGNVVKGNTVGPLTDDCTSNGYRGIDIEGGSQNNIIGGTGIGEANKIAGNLYWGIEVKEANTTGNVLSGNSMSCNVYNAISVNTGGNNNILAPVITAANATSVSGTSLANAVIEIFRAQDASVFGCPGTPQTQGADYLGTVTANGSGNWSLVGTFNGFLVATQRTTLNGSSAFSSAMNTGVAASWVNSCDGLVLSGDQPPVAGINASSSSICMGDCIDFSDASSGSPTSWDWTFEGADLVSSSDQNPPAVCYAEQGTFQVTLEVTNAGGSSTIELTVTVNSCTVVGCMYPQALNYDPLATADDGSCLFTECANDCVADLDGNGLVNVSDLLQFITYFGTLCPE